MTTQTTLSKDERQILLKALSLLEKFRTLDSEMQMPQAVTLLTVALNEGISLTELTEKTSQATSSASRNVAALSNVHRAGKPGHGLVLNREDPVERRRKQHVLTPKGRRFLEEVVKIVG